MSLGLVAYDSSDGEESGEEVEPEITVKNNAKNADLGKNAPTTSEKNVSPEKDHNQTLQNDADHLDSLIEDDEYDVIESQGRASNTLSLPPPKKSDVETTVASKISKEGSILAGINYYNVSFHLNGSY